MAHGIVAATKAAASTALKGKGKAAAKKALALADDNFVRQQAGRKAAAKRVSKLRKQKFKRDMKKLKVEHKLKQSTAKTLAKGVNAATQTGQVTTATVSSQKEDTKRATIEANRQVQMAQANALITGTGGAPDTEVKSIPVYNTSNLYEQAKKLGSDLDGLLS